MYPVEKDVDRPDLPILGPTDQRANIP